MAFGSLSEKHQIEIALYYEQVLEENRRKLELMTSENSVQLVYQLTILIYEYKVGKLYVLFNGYIFQLSYLSHGPRS